MKITSLPHFYRNLNRWREIVSVLSKYRLADWVSRFDSDFGKDLIRNRSGEALARQTRETRIRLALCELGPTFVKLGQVLSTRPDLIGVQLAEELRLLQCSAPADSPDAVRRTIETELGRPIGALFAEYDASPLASASIGQVHRARLTTGELVAVKVRHAGIEETIRVDLEIMAGLAQLAERVPEFANYRPRAAVAEFQRMLRRELDFSRELRSMAQFARRFAGNATIRIPRCFPAHSSERVLTMEFISGVPLSDACRHADNGFDLEEVARRGGRLYLEMIFEEGIYHADPHPGNIVLLENNVIGLFDFGMIGRIDGELRENIEVLLLSIADQDADQLTSVLTRIGACPATLDRAALTLDVADFVGHHATTSLADFNLSAALNDMTEIIRRYGIMLPAQVGMLLKVLVMLEGTSRLISPRFSLLELMQPYRGRMLLRRASPARRLRKLYRIYGELEHFVEVMPRRVTDLLQQVQAGKFDVHLDHRGLEPSVNRLVLGMLASALFLGSTLLLSHGVAPQFRGLSVPGAAGVALSAMLGVRLLRAINKSGRLDRRE